MTMTGEKVYDPPIPLGRCNNCPKELVAVARIYHSLELNGCYEYRYAHSDGTTECIIVRTPGPYSAWDATRKVEAEQRQRWDQEDAAASV